MPRGRAPRTGGRLVDIYLSTVRWPHKELLAVPRRAGAERVAADVRRSFLRDPLAPFPDLKLLCRAGRFKVIERTLGGAEGHGEAMLLPQPGNRFHIWVDAEPRGGWDGVPAAVRDDLRRHRFRFRVAHEMAHSFFYSRGPGEPRRLVPDSDAQERFADTFARSLLLPPGAASLAPPTAAGALALQRTYDVSVEVALRSLLLQHPTCVGALLYWPTLSDVTGAAAKVQWSSPGSDRFLARIRDSLDAMWAGTRSRPTLAPDIELLPSRRQAIWVAELSHRSAARAGRDDHALASAA